MSDRVRLATDLIADGFTHPELLRQVRDGTRHRVRYGAYVENLAPDGTRARHRQLIAGTVPRLGPGAVLSNASAAVVHDLPTWADQLGMVHVTRSQPAGGRRTRWVHVHPAGLEQDEIVQVDGLTVTSLARTIADLGRTGSYARAVIAADAALRLGLPREDLLASLQRAARRRGVGQGLRVARFADGRADNGGESVSRIVLHDLGLPAPEPQYEIREDATGLLLAQADFGWEDQRTLGEFDGRVKYGRLLKPDQEPGDVVFAEKVREDMLRDLGWEVVRWIWADLRRPHVIRERLDKAFARAARRRH
jgi:hypothetical protein